MASPNSAAPSRMRLIGAAVVVMLVVLATWKFIDYRQQAPPPPRQHGTDAAR